MVGQSKLMPGSGYASEYIRVIGRCSQAVYSTLCKGHIGVSILFGSREIVYLDHVSVLNIHDQDSHLMSRAVMLPPTN